MAPDRHGSLTDALAAATLARSEFPWEALLETAPYIKEDARIQTWGLGLNSALSELNNLGLTSTFNAGPMTVRVSGQII